MNYKTIISIIAALAIGVLAGKFLLGGKASGAGTAAETAASISTAEEIWTCSMHPQIRQPEPGDCPICGMDLIPLEASGGQGNDQSFEMTERAVKLANIQTTIIGSQTAGTAGLRLNGRIKADETRSASIVTHIPGRIEKLYVSFTGERISKGQQIATVYSPELISAQRELLEAARIAEVSPALLEAARNKLRFLKVPSATINEILETGQVRESFPIYADHGGVVMQRKVAVGDYLRTGEVLFDVLDLSALWVLFDLYESDLAKVRIGDRITFTTPSVPDKTFQGRISFVDPLINPSTRVATARVEVDNRSGQLKPDMFVVGTAYPSGTAKASLTVPQTAVLWTGKRSVVYVKDPGSAIPSYEYREVELGEAVGSDYLVADGLESGDEVVTHGAFVIDAAAQLNNRSSMMNRHVSVKTPGGKAALPDYTEVAPPAFKEQLNSLVKAYLSTKDALVNADVASARKSTDAMLNQLSKVDMKLLDGAAHNHWMTRHEAIKAHTEAIGNAAGLEAQRAQFEYLSQALIAAVKTFGITSDTLYVQHCPMVNNNSGADWLSATNAVRNPYFGEKMLTCGINTDTITKAYRNPELIETQKPGVSGHDH